METPIICDICGKIIDDKKESRNLCISTLAKVSVVLYEFHLHVSCMVDNSILKTMNLLIEKAR